MDRGRDRDRDRDRESSSSSSHRRDSSRRERSRSRSRDRRRSRSRSRERRRERSHERSGGSGSDRGGGSDRSADQNRGGYYYRPGGEPPLRDRRGLEPPPPPPPDQQQQQYEQQPPYYDHHHPYGDHQQQQQQQQQQQMFVPPPPPEDGNEPAAAAPTNSLLLRGLAPHSDEASIPDYIKPYCAVDAVRVVRDRYTFEPRGCLAFVDVPTPDDAQAVIVQSGGRLVIDGVTVTVEFSRSPRGSGSVTDWFCNMCHTNNFARRHVCFVCGAERAAAGEPPAAAAIDIVPDRRGVLVSGGGGGGGGGYDEAHRRLQQQPPPPAAAAPGSGSGGAAPPGPVLIVKGLDPSTATEPAIRAGLDGLAAVCGVPAGAARSVRLIRDKVTGVSRGFAFVEFGSVEQATAVLQQGRRRGVYIDGRPARLDYSLPPPSAGSAGRSNSAALDHVSWQLEQRQYQDATYQYGAPPDALAAQQQLSATVDQSVYELLGRINRREGTFVYNTDGGYYYEASSGLYYYPQPLNYYFHPFSRVYFVFDEASGDYAASSEAPPARDVGDAVATTTATSSSPSSVSVQLSGGTPVDGAVRGEPQQQQPASAAPLPEGGQRQFALSPTAESVPPAGAIDLASSGPFASGPSAHMPPSAPETPTAGSAAPPSSTGGPSHVKKDIASKKDSKTIKPIHGIQNKKMSAEIEKWNAAKAKNAEEEAVRAGPVKMKLMAKPKIKPVFKVDEEPTADDAVAAPADRHHASADVQPPVSNVPPPVGPATAVGLPEARASFSVPAEAPSTRVSATTAVAPSAAAATAAPPVFSPRSQEQHIVNHDTRPQPPGVVQQPAPTSGAAAPSLLGPAVCLLCKRQFPSDAALTKHESLSELHKTNLSLAKVRAEQQARDRVLQKQLEREEQAEERAAAAVRVNPQDGDLGEHNVGTQMLAKLGWRPGEGIGRQQVRNEVIEVQLRQDRSGLGMNSATSAENIIQPGDTYADAVRKRARSRFDDIENGDAVQTLLQKRRT